MSLYWTLKAFGAILILGALCEAKLGIDPDITIAKFDEIIADKERFARGKACFATEIDCPPLLQVLLDAFPEVYKTACANCDERERQLYLMGSRRTFLTDPIYFKKLAEKYDKDGVFWPAYVNFMFPEY